MKKSFVLLFLLCITLLGACNNYPSLQPGTSTDRDERIRTFLDGFVKADITPGVQYMVVNKDKVLFQYAAGKAVVNGADMELHTPMMLYSAGKLLTAAAVLQLVDREKIQIDDLLVKYLPNIPYKNVTIRQVLSHRSGIPDPFIGKMYVHPEQEHANFEPGALLSETLSENAELEFEPGTDVKYSNLGYALLGELIASVSGQTYAAYMRENVFKPLGMDSDIALSFDKFEPESRGYARRYSLMNLVLDLMIDHLTPETEDGWKTFKERWYFNFPAHGGYITHAPAITLFLQDMLADKSSILSAEMKSEFFRIQGEADSMLLNSTHNALSWFVNKDTDTPFYFHEGSAFGYISELRVYPDSGIASVMMVNTTHRDHKTVMDAIDKEFTSAIKGADEYRVSATSR